MWISHTFKPLMKLQKKKIVGLYEIELEPRRDERGFFMRIFDNQIFQQLGLNHQWFQDSRSYTEKKHTLRGLHVSLSPALEGKMIHTLCGTVLWISVDVRVHSPTFGQWESTVLTSQKPSILYAERGFAHGCLSLEDHCDLLLKADNHYSDAHGTGIHWNDPDLKIDWGIQGAPNLISERDQSYGSFKEFREKYKGVIP